MTMAAALPTRDALATEFVWNLESIYPSNEVWETDFAQVERELPELQRLEGTLGEDDEALLSALRLRDQVGDRLDRLAVYAFLRRDEDTTNPTYQALADRVSSLRAKFNAATAFFAPEVLAIDDTTYDRFMVEGQDLQLYDFYLTDLRRQREHIRSAEVEAVIARTAEIARGPSTSFGMLNDADIKFPLIRDEEGNDVELTKGRYILMLEAQDRRVRHDAFKALYSTYEKVRNTLAALYASSVRGDIFYAQEHHYQSSLHAALEPDSIPLEVYHNLVAVVNRNLPLLHRYISLRKKILGLSELHLYDMFVSLAPHKSPQISYDEARSTVEAALAPLGPDYSEVLHRGLYQDRWVDVHETQNKRGGAYSSGAYSTRPFVLMNWQDNVNNMYTLAHELGHAMHSYYTRQAQPYIYGGYTIFVAEVASTCNEALLTAHILRTSDDRELKLEILNQQLDAFRATLFRQTMFAEFELETHRRAEAGEALTTELLSQIYRELVTRYHGPDVVIDDEIALEWARIPHFYRAFYVYKYATGISAATALAKQISDEGQPAVDRYLQFLQGGRSQTSIDLLRGAGVDMTTPEPVEQAMRVFANLIDEYEAMINEGDRV